MQHTRTLGVTWALCALLLTPLNAVAQDAAPPTIYAVVDCMQSTSPDYVEVETEIWQPVHQELVNRGAKLRWDLYAVQYGERGECDYYTVNQYVGEEQLNGGPPFEEIFAAVHPGVAWDEVAAKTYAARRSVRSELWTMVDGVAFTGDAAYLAVNLMYAENAAEYEAMESEVYKPVAQALVDAGHRVGWGVWSLYAPFGTYKPYNYVTVDGANTIGPVPWAETIQAVHPDRDMDALSAATDAARSMVRSETWTRVASTEAP